jgi:hypothetical protein
VLLANTPEITLIHGLFRTSKTTLFASSAIKIVSNPDSNCKILYIVESNPVVDDVALCIHNLADKHGLSYKQIIRVYTLKDEKSKVYKYFDTQGHTSPWTSVPAEVSEALKPSDEKTMIRSSITNASAFHTM